MLCHVSDVSTYRTSQFVFIISNIPRDPCKRPTANDLLDHLFCYIDPDFDFAVSLIPITAL